MIHTFYNEFYGANTKPLSMRKLPLIASALAAQELAKFESPQVDEKILVESLKRIHSSTYVDAFLSGEGKLAQPSGLGWSEEIKRGVLNSVEGTRRAALRAVETGDITASISAGFHHARPERGGGFCTFNALALVAAQNPSWKVVVLDMEEHEGDGTTEFCKVLPNLYNFSIYGTDFGGAKNVQNTFLKQVCGWAECESALMQAFTRILDLQPDLILYQAGMDCVEGDDMATVDLTPAQAFMRDSMVFNFVTDFNIPLAFVVAGGYGSNAVKNHVGTWKAAEQIT